jgi:hypothetical protein
VRSSNQQREAVPFNQCVSKFKSRAACVFAKGLFYGNTDQEQLFSESSLLASTPASKAGSASSADPNGFDGRGQAQTWSFRACVRPKDGQTFSNLSDARKQQMGISLASASMTLWACTNTARIEPQYSAER